MFVMAHWYCAVFIYGGCRIIVSYRIMYTFDLNLNNYWPKPSQQLYIIQDKLSVARPVRSTGGQQLGVRAKEPMLC